MTLVRRGDIRWSKLTIDGRTVNRNTGFTHKGMAIAYEARLRVAARLRRAERLRRHGKRAPEKMTLGQAADRYIETVMLTKRKDSSGSVRTWVQDDFYRVERVTAYFGRNADLREVMRWASIADYNSHLLQTMSAESANRYLTYLKAILNKAYQWGAVDGLLPVWLTPA